MSKDDIQWAVDCWFQQVSNRPIKNIHRRTLDDTWRMVIRRLGGDDIALIGPSHDGSLAAQNIIRSNYEWETSNSEDEITRLRADLAAVTEERDALAARLAPVDDEALAEMDAALAAANGRVHAAELHAAGMTTQRDCAIRDRDAAIALAEERLCKLVKYAAESDALADVTVALDAWKNRQKATAAILKQVETERDALAAHLAPVGDEALVEIAAVAIRRNKFERTGRLDCFDPNNTTLEELGEGRAVIAAIRPHIEAAEREKWQKMLARMGAGTTKTGAVNE